MKKVLTNLIFRAQKNLPPFIGRSVFRLWWQQVRQKAPQELRVMIDHVLHSPSFAVYSPYWLFLARRNIDQILNGGYAHFKQTIARDYFVLVNWKRSGYYENLFKAVKASDQVPLANILKRHEFFGQEASVSYNVFTALLLNHVRTLPDAARYLKLEESPIGTPATITGENNKQVSSDLLNSILDYDSIFHLIPEQEVHTVMELGGGYGRNAYCNISLLPQLKRYIMVDIPPALFLSQTYISEVFPDKKVFTFRPFSSFAEIEKEFNASELVFLLPEQIELLPPHMIDLIIAIDCLHEMDKKQVDRYFTAFDRLGKNFYFKCWQKTESNFYQWGAYPAHPSWKTIADRATYVPAAYFETFYQITE